MKSGTKALKNKSIIVIVKIKKNDDNKKKSVGIFSSQKNDIIKSEDEIDIHTIDTFDETSSSIDKDKMDLTPVTGLVRNHIIKVLIYKQKAP